MCSTRRLATSLRRRPLVTRGMIQSARRCPDRALDLVGAFSLRELTGGGKYKRWGSCSFRKTSRFYTASTRILVHPQALSKVGKLSSSLVLLPPSALAMSDGRLGDSTLPAPRLRPHYSQLADLLTPNQPNPIVPIG